MNSNIKDIFKNLNYTLTANFLILIISIILNFIVPKYIGLSDYGYWQLYVFYTSYVGFFHLGLIDGIHLKIGGEKYSDLDKRELGTQFWILLIMSLSFSVVFNLYIYIGNMIFYKKLVLFFTAISLIVINLKAYILIILQSTNKIKEYAKLTKYDRYIYMILTIIYLLIGGKRFLILIIFDILAKIITAALGAIYINDIIRAKLLPLKIIVPKVINNIKSGSNLMLGHIASLLILGISRIMVERKWDINTFGKLSFTLSVSNMFMIFINAVSVVLYPAFRRVPTKKLPQLFDSVRYLLVPTTFLLLLLFNPVKILVSWWLPEYKESMYYMGILFPMIIYEGRMVLLTNTYLKTIRKEKIILITNLITVVIVTLISFFTVFFIENINLTVFGIILSLAIRSALSEYLLFNINMKNYLLNNIVEFFLVLCFILGNIYLSQIASFITYLICFVIVFLPQMSKQKESIYFLKNI